MDSRTLDVLGFGRIREILSDLSSTEPGRDLASRIEPGYDRADVSRRLDRLAEVMALPEEPPFEGIRDIRLLLDQLRVHGLLTARELALVARVCAGLDRCRAFLRRHRNRLGSTWGVAGSIAAPDGLEQAIGAAIDETGEVRDSASPSLAAIRRQLRTRRNALVKRLERITADNPGWFGGGATIRGDRLVLPVLVQHRDRVPGVVHATSSSGQTLFVEPLVAVGDGNGLQELRDAESEEEARILRMLSRRVGEHGDELVTSLGGISELDLLTAMRRYAVRFDCVRPELSDGTVVELVGARHPLLLYRRVPVVPLEFRFPDNVKVVLVSGPNAGGKTVVMKTVGLLSAMLGCGMFIPVSPGTRLPVFRRICADIGDEQSLESDMSSFTAHVARLSEMLAAADAETLVLADEVGASTAPEEGAALAMAVLEALRDRGARVIATTHFGRLKMFVQDEPGMVNAAMEWGETGVHTGQRGPTFRLRMGVPGESSALDIAAAAGLPADVVAQARIRVGEEWLELSAKLRALDAEIAHARSDRSQAAAAAVEARNLRSTLDRERVALEERVRSESVRLRDERERFLREKRREVENLVRDIRERGADRQSVVEAKNRIADELGELARTGPEPASTTPALSDSEPALPRVGDTVESRLFHRQGTLLEVEDEEGTVAFGQVRMKLPLADLVVARAAAREPAFAIAAEPVGESYLFSTRLTVLGMTREEASDAVRRFLDEAVIQDAREVSVVHGKGTGVLRRSLWDSLRRDSRIEAMRLADANQGGAGVTVITMKSEAGRPKRLNG